MSFAVGRVVVQPILIGAEWGAVRSSRRHKKTSARLVFLFFRTNRSSEILLGARGRLESTAVSIVFYGFLGGVVFIMPLSVPLKTKVPSLGCMSGAIKDSVRVCFSD